MYDKVNNIFTLLTPVKETSTSKSIEEGCDKILDNVNNNFQLYAKYKV